MPAPNKTKHYTAVIEIHKVTVTEYEGSGRGDDKTFRDKAEIARVVVRADTLDKLRTQVGGHIDLVSE